MKPHHLLIVACLLLVSFTRPGTESWKTKASNPDYLHRAVKEVTDAIVHDIYAPPVAARTYAYITVAAYEAARHENPTYQTLAGQLHDLTPVPEPQAGKECSFTLAAVDALLTVGKTMVISEDKVESFHQALLQEFKDAGMPDSVFQTSIQYGQQVAKHILAWAAKDHYKETRSYPKYSVTADNPGAWQPTPPAYMKAVEPHWGEIRTFLMDSAQQFKPLPATLFSTNKNSRFYKEAKDVQVVGKTLTPEQKAIALFWDCNPFKMNINGHVMYATKKISPGGHWVNITRLVCKKANADFMRTAEAYVCLCVTLADGFISCWDEKYRSNVIRPETYINQYIDADWMPLLQTPPFPEYTSGHSVISTASAVMLGKLFGENVSFADSTEVEFELPVRQFKSFKHAADEAAISRLYGGIHYRPSIVNGQQEGDRLGLFMTRTLKTRTGPRI